jgi:VanZ family protein
MTLKIKRELHRRSGVEPAATVRTTTTTNSARTYGLALLLVVIIILYGSLYPFEFRNPADSARAVHCLLSTWREWDHRGDLLANILLYVPFGFFAVNAPPSWLSKAIRFILALIAGVALSLAIELAQFHDAGRVTSMGDVYANAIGAALGAAAGVLVTASGRWPLLRELGAKRKETLLLAMFFAYRLYPYVPVIDLHKYWHAIRAMLIAPSLLPEEFLRYFTTWLFVGAVLHVLSGPRRFITLFALICAAEFAGKIVVVDNALKLNDLAGAGGAGMVWLLLLRRLPHKFGILALLFAAMVGIERLQPFEFEPHPRAFGWIPFAGLMQGSIGVNIRSFCQKFYEYGGLIWLLNRGGARLSVSTVGTAVFLLVTSFAERWLPGRSAEITDALIALSVGAVFAMLRERRSCERVSRADTR